MKSSYLFCAASGALAALSACGDPAAPTAGESPTLLPSSSVYRYVGRVDREAPNAPVLAGAASYVEFGAQGDSVVVDLRATDYSQGYTFAVVEVDGEARGRFHVPSDTVTSLAFALPHPTDTARVRVHHAAEALFARLEFLGARAEVLVPSASAERLAVFFGDSMSGGAAADTSWSACSDGIANANAYQAFPARIGRALGADYVVHSVSGRGLYTNWNGEDPPLPALLDYLYLDTAEVQRYDMAADDPDLAVVALGTNDLNSAPDLRPEFDSTTFERAYIDFVDRLVEMHPDVRILLAGTPMHREEPTALLDRILARVAERSAATHPGLEIATAPLRPRELHGCPAGPHPSNADHGVIAEELLGPTRALMAG